MECFDYCTRVTLDDYLTLHGIKNSAFGAKCRPPIHKTEIGPLRKRLRSPGALKVYAIGRATGGKVTVKDLLSLDDLKELRG